MARFGAVGEDGKGYWLVEMLRKEWHRSTSGIMSLVGIGEERLWGDFEANLDWEGRDRSSVEVGIWQLDGLELLRFIASVQGS